nr:GAF domain-containing sensor histidine kinase [Paenibacillus sp. GSMTC-2017]
MLDTVLERLLDVTGLTFGWIFLIEDNREYTFAADRNLPPGLLHNDKSLMQCGSCWCMDQYHDDQLNDAVNIMSCRRLGHAQAANYGDTYGYTHHATVPLSIGDRKFGILNVGAADRNYFTNEELALLQSVALQIGVAVERMRLHKMEEQRAVQFTRLGHFSRALNLSISSGLARVQIIERAVELLTTHFEWRGVALLEKVGEHYQLQALYSGEVLLDNFVRLPQIEANWLQQSLTGNNYLELSGALAATLISKWEYTHSTPRIHTVLAVRSTCNDTATESYLLIGCSDPPFLSAVDGEVLNSIAEHIAVAAEHARLEETRRELVRIEERNRLASDLHDSVSQMLFSISMTAKGAGSLLRNSDVAATELAIADMGSMSQEALKEMRSLIMQLRPANLDSGIVHALKNYGKRLGISVQIEGNDQLKNISPTIQETVWRIGQESLNNIAKHAATDRMEMAISILNEELIFVAQDNGCGMNVTESLATDSLGISIMKERALSLGGRLKLTSALGEGTLIEVSIPLNVAPNRGSVNN